MESVLRFDNLKKFLTGLVFLFANPHFRKCLVTQREILLETGFLKWAFVERETSLSFIVNVAHFVKLSMLNENFYLDPKKHELFWQKQTSWKAKRPVKHAFHEPFVILWIEFCRDDWIRTSDLLHPMQARYRAALRPVFTGFPDEIYSQTGGKCKN